MEAAARPADAFPAALAAALIGAERAAPAAADPLFVDMPDTDPGGALLARLAAQGLLHRAGHGLAAEALAPLPPLAAQGPGCPPAAADRLALLLAAGPSARARLREWCELAGGAGLRAPAWLLPALAPFRGDWPEAIDAIAGPELSWLAGSLGEAPVEKAAAEQDWTVGSPAERRAAFAAFRRRDPDGARAALEAGFRAEKADLRQSLVSALDVGLSEADAPFLETCLDDRSVTVRGAAQALLPRLTRSPYADRMAARASAALSIESRRRLLVGTRHDLVVSLPEEAPALARDGVEPSAYDDRGGGRRAALLRKILARAPLHAFAAHPPRLWIELALRSEWAAPLLDGLFAAVRRERDGPWARDLVAVLGEASAGRLGGVRPTHPLRDQWAAAAALLPAAEWEALVAGLIRAKAIDAVPAMLGHGPPAFTEGFTATLLDCLALVTRGSDGLRRDLAKPWFIHKLGERAWPGTEAAAKAAAILARLPEDDHGLRRQFAELAETLALRAAMRREFKQAETV